MSQSPEGLVGLYLRAQNLEQIRRIDDAVDLYEQAVASGFDSAGPYDRLIAIYRAREDHAQLGRIAAAALEHVRTFEDKRAWYESILEESRHESRRAPDRRSAEF